MIVRGLDVNEDWLFGKSLNDYRSDIDALEQDISTRLKSFLGDCFFEQTAGIDWFNFLGGKSELDIELAVAACLLNTTGVTGIIELSVVLNEARLITLTYKVETNLGQVNNVIVVQLPGGDFILTEDGDTITTEDGDPLITESGGSGVIVFLQDENGDFLTDENGDPIILE